MWERSVLNLDCIEWTREGQKLRNKTALHLVDAEESLVDSRCGICSRRIVSVEQFEFELKSSSRRDRSTHREQVGGYSDSGQRHSDEVDWIREWRVEAVGVALGTRERLALTSYADDKRNHHHITCTGWRKKSGATGHPISLQILCFKS